MMYWVYDISNTAFALLAVGSFILFGVGGLLAVRWLARRKSRNAMMANDVVSFYFSAIVGFYGITLGLISVGVWQTFNDADTKSSNEAAAVEAFYRDADGYPEPLRSNLRTRIAEYTRNVIDDAWPQQRRGLAPRGGSALISGIQKELYAFNPTNMREMAIHQETLGAFNRLIELRRLRTFSATTGLPATTWLVVMIGAAASIMLTWLFTVESLRQHLFLTGLYSALLGLLVFLIAALDNPYRGEFSVTPGAFEFVLERMTSS
jgi:hypothetical protein